MLDRLHGLGFLHPPFIPRGARSYDVPRPVGEDQAAVFPLSFPRILLFRPRDRYRDAVHRGIGRFCLDRWCRSFGLSLPHSPCRPAVWRRLGGPGHPSGLYPPFAPALLARPLVREVRAVLTLPARAPLAVAVSGNRRRATRPRPGRYTVMFSLNSPLRFC